MDILEDLWDARESARFIGLQLKIKDSTLETIVQSTTDKGEILRQILKEYLKGNGWRPVTRERLIKALETKMVGQRRLAEELRQKYSPASSGDIIVQLPCMLKYQVSFPRYLLIACYPKCLSECEKSGSVCNEQ